MAITERDRKVLKVLRDPTADLLAGIAGDVFAQDDSEPFLFHVLTEDGEYEGVICRFDYEGYYVRNGTNNWVIYGYFRGTKPFRLTKPTFENGTIEIVSYDFDDEGDEDVIEWQDVVWTD